MHIMLPSGGYDSVSDEARVTVTLHCTSAACRDGARNNGFLLVAYDADGQPAGTFDAWPYGAPAARARASFTDAPRVRRSAAARAAGR